MVTLTTDYGTFAAETEEAALKEARAARRKAAIEEKRAEAARDQARLYAYKAAFRVYDALANCKDYPGWRFVEPGTTYGLKSRYESPYYHYQITTEEGTAELQMYDGYTCIGSLENGAGWTMVLFMQDNTDQKIAAMAVGVHNGVVGTVSLAPIVTPERFRRPKKAGHAA